LRTFDKTGNGELVGMKLRAALILISIGLCTVTSAQCADSTSKKTPVFSGYASVEAGQIVQGFDTDGPKSHAWIEQGFIGLMADEAISERLHVLIAGEGSTGLSYRVYKGFVEYFRNTEAPRQTYTIKRGEGLLTLGNPENAFWQIEAGFFPYKYNPDVRNLGEYLFRSFPYPQFIINTFDRTYTDLLGLRVGNTLWGKFHWDFLFSSETHDYPLGDFSISLVADYKPFKALDVGAGIDLDRILPVNNDMTNPKNDPSVKYIEPDGSTGYFSYAGTKVMARASFDPKIFFPFDFFGSEDLRIYTEAAILGLKNYDVGKGDSAKAYYTDILKRIPILVGLNVPCFKLLDVIAVELEYFDNNYPNSFVAPFEAGNPVPTQEPYGIQHDKLKWSLYAKKSIGGGFFVVGQIARDHMIPQTNALAASLQDRTDVLLQHGDWWWTLKTQFDF
jgi:hypothetical protein